MRAPLPATCVLLTFHPCFQEGFQGFSGLELLEDDRSLYKISPSDKKAETVERWHVLSVLAVRTARTPKASAQNSGSTGMRLLGGVP